MKTQSKLERSYKSATEAMGGKEQVTCAGFIKLVKLNCQIN